MLIACLATDRATNAPAVGARDMLGQEPLRQPRDCADRSGDNDRWALPGGAVDLGESVLDAAVRETIEETGVTVEVTGLVGLYTSPRHVMAYDDGEVRQQFSVCFHARPLAGQPREDGTETKAAQWVDVADLGNLSIHPSMRQRIDDALSGRSEPRIT